MDGRVMEANKERPEKGSSVIHFGLGQFVLCQWGRDYTRGSSIESC